MTVLLESIKLPGCTTLNNFDSNSQPTVSQWSISNSIVSSLFMNLPPSCLFTTSTLYWPVPCLLLLYCLLKLLDSSGFYPPIGKSIWFLLLPNSVASPFSQHYRKKKSHETFTSIYVCSHNQQQPYPAKWPFGDKNGPSFCRSNPFQSPPHTYTHTYSRPSR